MHIYSQSTDTHTHLLNKQYRPTYTNTYIPSRTSTEANTHAHRLTQTKQAPDAAMQRPPQCWLTNSFEEAGRVKGKPQRDGAKESKKKKERKRKRVKEKTD